jgi:hypothetical protein
VDPGAAITAKAAEGRVLIFEAAIPNSVEISEAIGSLRDASVSPNDVAVATTGNRRDPQATRGNMWSSTSAIRTAS